MFKKNHCIVSLHSQNENSGTDDYQIPSLLQLAATFDPTHDISPLPENVGTGRLAALGCCFADRKFKSFRHALGVVTRLFFIDQERKLGCHMCLCSRHVGVLSLLSRRVVVVMGVMCVCSAHVQLSTSVSIATSAKRAFLQEKNSAATRSSARNPCKMSMGRLKNTEQRTSKRKKQQCFHAEFEPDVRTSQAYAKVYAPLGSCVWHVKTAGMERAASRR